MTLILPSRRGFLTGLLSLVAAPAIVRADSLMPVRLIDLTPSDRSLSFWEGDPRRGGSEVLRRPVIISPITRVSALAIDPHEEPLCAGRQVSHVVVCGRVLPVKALDLPAMMFGVDPSEPQDWSEEFAVAEQRFNRLAASA